jgi:hypothetical protein
MRNGDTNRDTEALTPDAGVYSSAATRRSRRRKQAAIGAVGLAAILGIGAVVAQQVFEDDDTTPAAQPGALAPLTAASPSGSTSTSKTSTGPSAKASRSATAAPKASSAPSLPKTDAERIAAARSAAAQVTRTPAVRRPLSNGGVAASVSDADVTQSTVQQDGESITVTSARKDLTGFRQLAWVVDKGVAVGKARCTSKIRLSANVAPRERPTLLLCWRTSAEKSVYTVAVTSDGRPSKALSAAEIDKEWSKLG